MQYIKKLKHYVLTKKIWETYQRLSKIFQNIEAIDCFKNLSNLIYKIRQYWINNGLSLLVNRLIRIPSKILLLTAYNKCNSTNALNVLHITDKINLLIMLKTFESIDFIFSFINSATLHLYSCAYYTLLRL